MKEHGSAIESLEDRAAHRRITAALGGLHAAATPRDDWQARVLASVRAARPEPAEARTEAGRREAAPDSPWRFWRHWLPMSATCAAAAAGAVMMVAPRILTERPGPALAVELDATRVAIDRGREAGDEAAAYRSDAPAVGARVRVAATSPAAHRALWIFRGRDELVLSCPGPGCTASDDRLATELTVPRIGEYLVVALWSSEPIAPPPAARDEALAAAERAGLTQRSYHFTVW